MTHVTKELQLNHLDKLDKDIKELEDLIYNPENSEEFSEDLEVKEEGSKEPEVDQPATPAQPRKRVSYKAKVTELEAELASLDVRYRNLRSATDQKLHDLRTANTTLEENNLLLAKEIQDLKKKVVQNAPDPYENIFTEEDIETLGEDAINSFKKATQKAVDAAVNPLKQEIETAKEKEYDQRMKSLQEQQKNAVKNFREKLGELVPDYETININPDFKQFLYNLDTFSGIPKLTLLKRAEQDGDVGRVAQFFKDFKDSIKTPEDVLNENIAPTGTSTGTAVDNTRPELIPYAEFAKFQDDVTKGRYRGREKLKQELTDKYDRAFIEGRLV